MAEKKEFELLAPVMSSHRDSDGQLHRHVKGDMVSMDPERAKALGPRVFNLEEILQEEDTTVSDPTGVQATIPGDAPGLHIDKHSSGEQSVADPDSGNRVLTKGEVEREEDQAPKDTTEHQGPVRPPADADLAAGTSRTAGRRTTGRR